MSQNKKHSIGKIGGKAKMSTSFFGVFCGIMAAVCYGTNPLGALKLYAQGMQTGSVLFYRFGLAWLIIAGVMLVRSIATIEGVIEELCPELGLFTVKQMLKKKLAKEQRN